MAHFDRLGVFRLLSLIPDSRELRDFMAETLGGLADDDDRTPSTCGGRWRCSSRRT